MNNAISIYDADKQRQWTHKLTIKKRIMPME
jgi:hypothetical protein